MPRQPAIDLPEDEEDHHRHGEEHQRRHGEVQIGVEVALEQLARAAHQVLLLADHRQGEIDDRRGMEQEHHLVGIGRPGQPDHMRPGNRAELLPAAHAVGARRLDLAARHGAQGAVEDLGGIGRGVEHQNEGADEQRVQHQPVDAERAPQRHVERQRQRIEHEELDEQRRAAEAVDVAARQPVDQRIARRLAEGEQHREDEAERDGRESKIDVVDHRRREDGELGDQHLDHARPSLSMPRPARRISAANAFSDSQVTRM
jgi:hypothetical protein